MELGYAELVKRVVLRVRVCLKSESLSRLNMKDRGSQLLASVLRLDFGSNTGMLRMCGRVLLAVCKLIEATLFSQKSQSKFPKKSLID